MNILHALRPFCILVLILLGSAGITAAQTTTPRVTSFSHDATGVIYDTVEGGTATVRFSWSAAGVDASYRMQMHAFVHGEWVLIGQNFAATKSDDLVLAHPLSFAAPTYRLSIVDNDNRIVDQRIVTVPYAPADPDGVPHIVNFSSSGTPASAYQTIQTSGSDIRPQVTWEVANRLPDTNLIFEQQLPDGSYRNAELPRMDDWVRSRGEGLVALTPLQDNKLVLRLRLVDIRAGTTLDTAQITLPIIDAPAPTLPPASIPQQTPTPPVDSVTVRFDAPQLAAFGQTFMLTWEVSSTTTLADEVVIREWNGSTINAGGKYGYQYSHLDSYGGTPASEWTGLPLQGTVSVTVDALPTSDLLHDVTIFSLYLRKDGVQLRDEDFSERVTFLRTQSEATTCTPQMTLGSETMQAGNTVMVNWDACGLPFVHFQSFEADGAEVWSPVPVYRSQGETGLVISLTDDRINEQLVRVQMTDSAGTLLAEAEVIVSR